MKNIIIGILIILVFVSFNSTVFTQVKNNSQDKNSDKLSEPNLLPLKSSFILPKGFSIFNPERFKMTHSYSMFYSSGKFGGIGGLYTNAIDYKISDAVNMSFRFGYMFKPGIFNSKNNSFSGFNNGIILPNFDLKYQPSQNTVLRFSFRTYTSGIFYNPIYFDDYYWNDDIRF